MMCKIVDFSEVLARALLAAIFILAAIGKLNAPAETMQQMQSHGIPAFLYLPTVVFELIGGLFVLIGLLTRPVALGLAVFSVASGVIFHTNFADQTQMIMFLKNLAIAGGMLMLAKHGAQKWALDRKFFGRREVIQSANTTN